MDESIRVDIDFRDEKLGYKIRKSQLEKIPFMVILGDKEMEEKTLSIRSRTQGDLGTSDLESFIQLLKKENTLNSN